MLVGYEEGHAAGVGAVERPTLERLDVVPDASGRVPGDEHASDDPLRLTPYLDVLATEGASLEAHAIASTLPAPFPPAVGDVVNDVRSPSGRGSRSSSCL